MNDQQPKYPWEPDIKEQILKVDLTQKIMDWEETFVPLIESNTYTGSRTQKLLYSHLAAIGRYIFAIVRAYLNLDEENLEKRLVWLYKKVNKDLGILPLKIVKINAKDLKGLPSDTALDKILASIATE
jgi:hypothetical protein